MANHAIGHDAVVGQTLGHYRIIEKIGAGGMGEVYRAQDQHLDREVAIKVLPPGTLADEHSRKRFRKEAQALSKLNHPNIATIHDFDTQLGVDFLVMEYIPGITLSEKLAKRSLPEKEVIALGAQLAEGLCAAHEHGVVHRDLKPGNLRLTGDGRLKILDFGLAKLRLPVTASATTESLTGTETMAGTLPYMAPEQLLGGEIDARTDIHAAGSVLYEMATGQRAFAEVERSQLIGAILRTPPRPPTTLNHKLSSELERIIGKCLEKEPENRYQSAKELAVDLRRLSAPSGGAPVRAAAPKTLGKIAKDAVLGLAVLLAVAVLLIAFNAGGWRDRVLRQGSNPKISSLAVLPLANLSRDPEQDYFADGMTEALITELAKIGSLKVISRTSVMQYKGAKKTVREIAHELDVAGVVEGSVLRSGDRVRVSAQLIDAREDRNLWADSYDRDLRDVLALHSEVARAIADQVRAVVTPAERQRLAGARSVNPEAYQAYLKGRHYWSQRNFENLHKGIEQFRQAIAIDPRYAPAYAGLADSYLILSSFGLVPANEGVRQARAAAQQALILDENLAEAHTSLADILAFSDWNWVGAEKEFRRALELNPSYATGNQWYAEMLMAVGRSQESLAEVRKAQEVDPLSPAVNAIAGWLLYIDRQYDAAIRQEHKVVEMYPDLPFGHFMLGAACWGGGRRAEAVAAFEKAYHLEEDRVLSLAFLTYAYAQSGRRTEALQLRQELKRREKVGYVSPHALAVVSLGFEEKEQALTLLEKVFERGGFSDEQLRQPIYDPIRSDPRFTELVRKVGLAQ